MDFHNKEILKRYARMVTGRPFAPILLNILITFALIVKISKDVGHAFSWGYAEPEKLSGETRF